VLFLVEKVPQMLKLNKLSSGHYRFAIDDMASSFRLWKKNDSWK
jgi:hypothetical protein